VSPPVHENQLSKSNKLDAEAIWLYIRSPKPVLLGKIGGNLRKFAEQKICPRRNWRISQFLVLKNRKNPFFHNFLFKIPIIPIWPLNSFFPSKTSLYRLKLLFRVKKNCQNNYGTLLTTVSNHYGLYIQTHSTTNNFSTNKSSVLFLV
jgi:hypothetical protein